MKISTDCRHFKGDIPCAPHKKHNIHCESCIYYEQINDVILIIKLGAIGDVIRTTPLLRRIKKENPNSYIIWLTQYPDILSNNWVDRILKVNLDNIELVKQMQFDWVINLDKEPLALSITKCVESKRKSGFTLDRFGHAKPISNGGENHKWLTGLFDDVNKENTKHYMEEIFEICEFNFNDEEYILDVDELTKDWDIDKSKKVIGLNTGCGKRWLSRLWPIEYWIKLSQELLSRRYEVILLGGLDEHNRNIEIQKATSAKYFGHFELNTFINLVNHCDLVVTSVSMAMHLAIGLKKKLVLFNNIFNKNEFYLYGRGEILEPDFDCNCYYQPKCKNNCMQYLLPEKVLDSIEHLTKS